jgi:cytochrome P450
MVSETIRWQTPLAHMRRTATAGRRAGRQDHQEGRQGRHVVRLGQPRRHGDREPRTPTSSTAKTPASHLSFGFGIHRCVGNRLAELQLKIVWEEILVEPRRASRR